MVNYATTRTETSARMMGVSLPISFKQSVEVCREIRGRELGRALRLVRGVVDGKEYIRYKRFKRGGIGHKPGIGPARTPVKTCLAFVKLLEGLRSHAEQRGLDTAHLVIRAAIAKKGAIALHYGRHGRREMKRTHVELVVEGKQKAPPKQNRGEASPAATSTRATKKAETATVKKDVQTPAQKKENPA